MANITLTATGSGVAPLSYHWTKTGGTFVSTNLNTNTVIVSEAGTYTVTVTDGNNRTSSSNHVVQAGNGVPVVSISSSTTVLSTNGTILLTGSVSGVSGVFSYQWFKNGNLISGATGISYTINSIGTYTLEATPILSAQDCFDYTFHTYSIHEDDSYTINYIDCNDVSLTATGYVNGTDNPFIISCIKSIISTDFINYSTNVASVVCPSDVITGCIGRASKVITAYVAPASAPIARITSTTPFTLTCSRTSITLNGSTSSGTGTLSYLWSTGATTQTINVTTAGTYTLTVTDSSTGLSGSTNKPITSDTSTPLMTITSLSSINVGGTLVLTATLGFASYYWSTGETTQQITINSAGTYTVNGISATNGCTSNTASKTINLVANNLAVTISNNNGTVLDCDVSNTTISANPTGNLGVVGYSWSTGATTKDINITTAGTYVVVIIDNANGYQATNSITITTNYSGTVPTANIAAHGLLPCNSTLVLDGSGSIGTGTLIYYWQGPGIVSGAGTSSITINKAGTYVLNVHTDANFACTNNATSVVVLASSPTVTIPAPLSNIPPVTLTSVISGGASPYSYQWYKNSIIVGGGTFSSINVTTNGTYSVTVTDNNGCTGSASRSITITTSDTQAPTTPLSLSSTQSVSLVRIYLNWNASSDNIGVVGYEIYRSDYGLPYAYYTIVGGTTLNYTDTGIAANREYCYKVKAKDAAGNLSAFSNLTCQTIYACFVEGTMIQIDDYISVPIEMLNVGDMLLSSKIDTLQDTNNITEFYEWNDIKLIEERVSSEIKNIYESETNNTIIINEGLLEATPEHSQLAYRNGQWEFMRMGNIKVGDMLYNLSKEIIEVTSVEVNIEPRIVYKMELLSPYHTFFANGILTHNAKAPIQQI